MARDKVARDQLPAEITALYAETIFKLRPCWKALYRTEARCRGILGSRVRRSRARDRWRLTRSRVISSGIR